MESNFFDRRSPHRDAVRDALVMQWYFELKEANRVQQDRADFKGDWQKDTMVFNDTHFYRSIEADSAISAFESMLTEENHRTYYDSWEECLKEAKEYTQLAKDAIFELRGKLST